MNNSNPLRILWNFVIGDISNDKFEMWVYENSEILEEMLSNELSLSLISATYKNEDSIIKLKQALEKYLDKNFMQKCECLKWKKYQHFDLG